MEETISTPVETTTEQTPLESVNASQPEQNDVQTPENAEQEPAKSEETAENVEEGQQPEKIDWEKRAKDQQANFTRVSQEKAELTKRIEELESRLKPKIVEDGKINPDFEKRYKMDIDNQEYLAFDNLARRLEPEARAEVEKLLLEAKTLYNPYNNSAYNAKLNQIKDYFRSDIVEAIAVQKQQLQGQLKTAFDREIAKYKEQRANVVAEAIKNTPEIRDLVTADSENYSKDVFDIVNTVFELTGNVDIEGTKNAITKIKELGVKEYLAKQNAETQKQNATVPSGDTVLQENSSPKITAEMASKNYQKYIDGYMKKGMSFHDAMNKVDEIIMKG